MLKVMKYDWKNGWIQIRVVLLMTAVLSAVVGFALSKIDSAASSLSVIWFAVMLAVLVLTVNIIFQNMTSRMFGTEGYLTHTLPVDTWELLLGKAAGTWIFGAFMVMAAVVCWTLLLVCGGSEAANMTHVFVKIVEALPKLGGYFFRTDVIGVRYVVFAIPAFLAASFLVMIQFQFVCILAQQFGRFRIAGGLIVFLVMGAVEGLWNHSEPIGFLLILLFSAVSFAGSHWLLKHRLSV